MNFLPYIVVWVLLVAISVTVRFSARRASILPPLSIALNLIAILVWFVARPSPSNPATLTLAQWPTDKPFSGWAWRVDEFSWQLTGIVLWLALCLLLYQTAVSAHPPQFTWVGLLSSTVLLTLWSTTPATLLTTWTLFLLVSWFARQATRPLSGTAVEPILWRTLIWPIIPLLLYWLATALAGATTANTLIIPDWPANAVSLALFAVALQMGIWPFTTPSRMLINSSFPSPTILLHLLPLLIGISLLCRLVAVSAIPFSSGLLLTLLSIVSLIAGVWFAWIGSASNVASRRPAAGLSLALGSLTLLTGIWTGTAAIVAVARVTLFVSAVFFLLRNRQTPSSKLQMADGRSMIHLLRPRVVAMALIYLAIAGLPPTAGFASLAPLYRTWLMDGRPLLVVALALTLIPLLTITYRFTQRLVWRTTTASEDQDHPTYKRWAAELAPLLLALGTISLRGYLADNISWGVWVALIVAALVGLLLPHFLGPPHRMGPIRTVRTALREALTIRPLQNTFPTLSRKLVTPLTNAFADAYAILESDTGLLWLFGLLLLFWWIS